MKKTYAFFALLWAMSSADLLQGIPDPLLTVTCSAIIHKAMQGESTIDMPTNLQTYLQQCSYDPRSYCLQHQCLSCLRLMGYRQPDNSPLSTHPTAPTVTRII